MSIHTGVEDYLCPLDPADLPTVCQYAKEPEPPGSFDFLQMAKRIMQDHYYDDLPDTVEGALDLYITLTTTVEQHMT